MWCPVLLVHGVVVLVHHVVGHCVVGHAMAGERSKLWQGVTNNFRTSFDYNCVICHYSPKYDLYITLRCQSVRENIPATCRMEERKLVHAFSRITSRNTRVFQQQDKHRILLTLASSSTGFTWVFIHICKNAVMCYMPKKTHIILSLHFALRISYLLFSIREGLIQAIKVDSVDCKAVECPSLRVWDRYNTFLKPDENIFYTQ